MVKDKKKATGNQTKSIWRTAVAVSIFAAVIGIVFQDRSRLAATTDWNSSDFDPSLAEESERCNFERIFESDMTHERFAEEFWRRKPVIILRDKGINAAAQLMTEKHALLNRFGDKIIPLAKLESYAFRDEQSGSLSDYITAMSSHQGIPTNTSRFAFSSDQYGVGNVYVVPNVMDSLPNVLDPNFQLAVAGSGAGLAFHWHADVFAETLHGTRRWLLFPPEISPKFNPRTTSAEWVRNIRPEFVNSEAFQECTLSRNEAIYVPADWFHSTLSLGEAVSITTSYASTYRRDRYRIEEGPADNAHMLDAFTRHDFETASRFAEQLKNKRPNSFVPYSWLGVILTLDAKERHTGSLEDFRSALQAGHDATLRCVELNPLFCPCHVWLSRQLMGLSATYKGIDASKEESLAAKAEIHRKIAGNLSSVNDDEMLDPRWQPRSMNEARRQRSS